MVTIGAAVALALAGAAGAAVPASAASTPSVHIHGSGELTPKIDGNPDYPAFSIDVTTDNAGHVSGGGGYGPGNEYETVTYTAYDVQVSGSTVTVHASGTYRGCQSPRCGSKPISFAAVLNDVASPSPGNTDKVTIYAGGNVYREQLRDGYDVVVDRTS